MSVAMVSKTKIYFENVAPTKEIRGSAIASSLNKKAGAIINAKEKAIRVCITVLSVGKLKNASIK